MKNELVKIAEYCKENKVEINIDADGISIWTDQASPLHLKISNIKAKKVVAAVDTLNDLRGQGWEAS